MSRRNVGRRDPRVFRTNDRVSTSVPIGAGPVLPSESFNPEALADLAATGEVRLLENCQPRERAEILTLVGAKRRRRLIRFIAQAIAQDIQRSKRP